MSNNTVVGNIYQYRLDKDDLTLNSSIYTVQLNPELKSRIGLSTKERNYFRIYDNDLAQDGNDEIIMTITYADNTTESIQLGKTFMYDSLVGLNIKTISFSATSFPPGTYLEVRYEE